MAQDRGGRIIPIEPGFIERAAAAARMVITGDNSQWAGWFGPGVPLPPIAQEAEGRQLDYPFGANIQSRPRADEAVSFDTMRQLADNYDLMRLVIETRKDQLDKMEWVIRCKEDKGNDKRAQELSEFFQSPDKQNSWSQWLRALLEDLLVIDAPTVYNHSNLGGKPYAIELIDGSTIQRIISIDGRSPIDGPAYQQVLKGVKAVDYTRDELIYMPRNVRTNRLYGYSPVEQVMMTVNIAIRRQINQLGYYTHGNAPDLIIGLPKEWQPAAVKQFQEWWNSLISSDDQTQRRKTRFVPEGLKVIDTKDRVLKDEYDEWLARVICYAFSVSPQAFIKQMNRSTAETAQQQAIEEGLAPLAKYVRSFMDTILLRFFKETDYEFAWVEEQSIDPLEQAQVHQIQIASGLRSVDEIRENDLKLEPMAKPDMPDGHEPVMGEDGKPKLNPDGTPVTQPKAAEPVAGQPTPEGGAPVQDTALNGTQITSLLAVTTAVGDTSLPKPSAIALLTAAFPNIDPKTIGEIINPIEAKEPPPPVLPPQVQPGSTTDAQPKKLTPGAKPGEVPKKGKVPPAPFGKVHIHKGSLKVGPTSMDREAVQKAEKKMRAAFKKWFRSQVNPIASQITEALGKVAKLSDEERVAEVMKNLGFKNPTVIRDTAEKMLAALAADSGYEALQAIAKDAVDYDKMLSMVNERAATWAEERAGKLVTSIDETTREMLKGNVEQAIKEGMSTADLADALADSYAFSDARAETIARTELAAANVEGTLEGYRESGMVEKLDWLVSQDDTCDECMEMLGVDGDIDTGFNGEFPPLHPNCRCDVLPVLTPEAESEKIATLTLKGVDSIIKGMKELMQPPPAVHVSFPSLTLNIAKDEKAKAINFSYDENGRVSGGKVD